MKLPLSIKIFITVAVVLTLVSIIANLFSGSVNIYNKTTELNFKYSASVQNQIATYDNYYLAFQEKYDIANVNKETFVEVTNIIMSARKDGMSLAWKWVTENQQIPYKEFTEFYKDLSNFTSTRFAENNTIEREKQNIVKEHNYTLKSYPGNVYNYFLKIPPLEYQAGFISDKTKLLFKK